VTIKQVMKLYIKFDKAWYARAGANFIKLFSMALPAGQNKPEFTSKVSSKANMNN